MHILGGLFAQPSETLSPERNSIGSLVISLPVMSDQISQKSQANAGAMKIIEPGYAAHPVSFTWTGECKGLRSSWCSIFKDSAQQPTSTLQNFRVTLTYDILSKKSYNFGLNESFSRRYEEEDDDETDVNTSNQNEHDKTAAATLLDIVATALASRQRVGILCKHQYGDISENIYLKGADRMIFELMSSAHPGRVKVEPKDIFASFDRYDSSYSMKDNDFGWHTYVEKTQLSRKYFDVKHAAMLFSVGRLESIEGCLLHHSAYSYRTGNEPAEGKNVYRPTMIVVSKE
jgi:hypothetical protein